MFICRDDEIAILTTISLYLDEADINNFARTSRDLYNIFNPLLYAANSSSTSSALRWAAAHDEGNTAKLSLNSGACQRPFRVEAPSMLLPEYLLEHYEHSSKPRELSKRYEVTPLWIAAAHGHCGVAALLINYGCDIDVCRPISAAVCSASSNIVKLLLAHGAQVEDPFEWKISPLELAIVHNDVDCARLLLEGGAVVPAQSEHNHEYLSEQFHDADSRRMIHLLIDYGAFNTTVGESPWFAEHILSTTVRHDWPEIFDLMLRACVASTTDDAEVALAKTLTAAVSEKRPDYVFKLLEVGVRPDAWHLMRCIVSGPSDLRVVRLLVAFGAGVDHLVDIEENEDEVFHVTPLETAALYEDPAILKIFLTTPQGLEDEALHRAELRATPDCQACLAQHRQAVEERAEEGQADGLNESDEVSGDEDSNNDGEEDHVVFV